MERTRKYQDGEKVYSVNLHMDMIVVSAEECLKGWRYQLAFLTKDGLHDKRKSHRFFFEDTLTREPKD